MQLFTYDHVPVRTKFNIKQNNTVKLSLIDGNNSNKKSQCIVEVLSFSHVFKCKGSFLSINLSLLNI